MIDVSPYLGSDSARPENPYPTSVGEKLINSLCSTALTLGPQSTEQPQRPLHWPFNRCCRESLHNMLLNVFQESRAKTFTGAGATGFLSTPSRITRLPLLLSSLPASIHLRHETLLLLLLLRPPHTKLDGEKELNRIFGGPNERNLSRHYYSVWKRVLYGLNPNMGNNELETGVQIHSINSLNELWRDDSLHVTLIGFVLLLFTPPLVTVLGAPTEILMMRQTFYPRRRIWYVLVFHSMPVFKSNFFSPFDRS